MKKLISTIATFALTSSAALPLIACSPDDSLKIAFVPSKDAIKVMNIVKPLEGLLKNKIKELDPEFNRSVKITTTTDYQAAGQALQDGKTALAFLPMGTYIDYRGRAINPGNYADAAPLVIAQRNAMRPETNNKTSEKRIIDTNEQMSIVKNYNEIAAKGIESHEDAYKKLYHQTDEHKSTSFYRAEIIVNNNFLVREKSKVDIDHLFDDATTYKTKIQQLIKDAKAEGKDKIQLLTSNTSGAGVIYPVQWMLDNGVEKTEIADILKNQSRVESFTAAAQNVANGASDITFGYTDIRADAEQVKKDYENTTMIGLTSGVPNDGISYSKKAIKDQKLLAAIREAFKELINDPKNAEIFDVYSHTDYITPSKDATPEQAATWETEQNDKYNQATNEIKDAIDLIKASQ
ncbi:PhnD/SsuA/transferrin family substrate-binding protein [Spiroplasma endosymbiont of Dasysyrphus albostriatus]|uniref:PhnD/SsuA/transferrin family substrate-binding protein n=1 Tax=Spiroplasma endosymbiont of Dasysyrphus albostriatus TaxID=3066299 RepID=UPI0030D37309